MLESLDDDMRAAIFLELQRIGWNRQRAENQLTWRREPPATAPVAPSRRLVEPEALR